MRQNIFTEALGDISLGAPKKRLDKFERSTK